MDQNLNFDALAQRLEAFQQSHLLDHWERLTEPQRLSLASQIQAIDLELLDQLAKSHEVVCDWASMADAAEPPPAVQLDLQHPAFSVEEARAAGDRALRQGSVGVILVAGGQGTRLGFDHPKALFPIGPISQRTLFEMHVDRLQAVARKYRVQIPLYVMTSPATDAETRQYLQAHDHFGMTADDLVVICQGTMPAVEAATGKILLQAPHEIALSPDGHGGLVQAIAKNDQLVRTARRGIDRFYYAQIDNPLAEIGDPVLIGYHVLAESEMTTQVVKKRFATEKVGNVVFVDDRVQIIEYSDLPEEVAQKVNPDGSLYLWAANIAIHVLDRSFLESVTRSDQGLPFHRAHKAVPHIDSQGNHVAPDSPNGIKFERFIFDLLPRATRTLVVEGDPARVFAPVKNADGAAVDTPAHARDAIAHLHRNWLQAAGATVSEGVKVEINPRWALDETEVAEKIEPGLEIVTDTYFQ